MQASDAHQQLSEPSLGGFDTDLDSGTIGRASMGESMHMPAQPSIGYGEFSRARHGMDTSYVSALKRLGACLTPESGASQPPRLNVISRHSSAGQPGVVSPRSSAPSFGGWFSKKSSDSKAASSSHNEASEANELPQFRLYHVPYISQGSERMGCWYACAKMVAYSVETAGSALSPIRRQCLQPALFRIPGTIIALKHKLGDSVNYRTELPINICDRPILVSPIKKLQKLARITPDTR